MSRIAYSRLAALPGSMMPRLTLHVFSEDHAVQLSGIVDSGSATNLLPYEVGRSLGFDWNRQRRLGRLAGGLSNVESRAVSVLASFPEIVGANEIPLIFAQANSNEVPVLLGQTNFFMEFNACFYHSQNYFEVWRRDTSLAVESISNG